MPKYHIVNSKTGRRRTVEIPDGANVLAMLEDGEVLQISMNDEDRALDQHLADTYGHVSDEALQDVQDARDEMIARTCNAWRGDAHQPIEIRDSVGDATQDAYEAYCAHIQNAWRGSR